MTNVIVSAPGKAVLCGEYAVLQGAPAVSLAIDRRARVRLRSSHDEFHTLSTPGYVSGSWRFRATPESTVEWLDEPPAEGLGLFEETWRAAAGGRRSSLSITIDSREFFDSQSGHKLGFGSSAAVTAALVAALGDPGSRTPACWPLAREVHRAFLGGRGSGVDVATSCHGGLITYTKGCDRTPPRQRWPEGLAFRFFYSGQPADTFAAISDLEASPADAASCSALAAAASAAAGVWAAGDAEEVLDATRLYTDALQQFNVAHDLGIFDAGHDTLVELAGSVGTVYKPCGAGGGDIGIVLATSVADIDHFQREAEGYGFVSLDVQPDDDGVKEEAGTTA
jgi:phosphomevalonate kinase